MGCSSCCELALSLLLRDLDVRHIVLPIPVFLYRPKNVPNHLFLPRQQHEVLSVPFALRMLQRLYERYCSVSEARVRNELPVRDEYSVFLQ